MIITRRPFYTYWVSVSIGLIILCSYFVLIPEEDAIKSKEDTISGTHTLTSFASNNNVYAPGKKSPHYATEIRYQSDDTVSFLEQLEVYVLILIMLFIIACILAIWAFNISRERDKALEKVKKINAEKDFFIGVVSHDLRSPLNSIVAISSLMIEGAKEIEPDTIKDYSTILINASQRMEHLINNMLDANKIETGNTKLHIEPFFLQEVINNLYSSSVILGDEKNIRTKLLLEDDLPQIMADSNAIYRVLENLISNAYKFSTKGSTVTISASCVNNQIQLSITDQGPGLTEADRSKLFEKFQTLSAVPTANEKTTGLGLYIVKNLVQEMNGTILVESELGNGTTFTVLFNIA